MLKTYREKYDDYYEPHSGNYCIPVEDFTEEVLKDTLKFIKTNKHNDYYLSFARKEDGYVEDYWCVSCAF